MNESSGEEKPVRPKSSPLNTQVLSHERSKARIWVYATLLREFWAGVVKVATCRSWSSGRYHIYVAVLVKPERKAPMPFLNHNGLDSNRRDVDECHGIVVRAAENGSSSSGGYSMGPIAFISSMPIPLLEILANPPGGYCWMFRARRPGGVGNEPYVDRPRPHLPRRPKNT